MGYNFGCMIASDTQFDSRGGFLGSSYPTKTSYYNTWFLGSSRVLNPNRISFGSVAFAGLTTVTDWQTTLLGL